MCFKETKYYRAFSLKENRNIISIISSIFAFFLSGILLSKGIGVITDSWAYWEGSVSILNGNGYEYFGGQNITGFPPMYPIYLTILQYLFGVSGSTLILSNMILSGLTVFVWVYLFISLVDENTNNLIISILIVFIIVYIVDIYITILSETLGTFLIGLSFIFLYDFLKHKFLNLKVVALLILTISTLLLTRNSAVLLLPGYFIVIFIFKHLDSKIKTIVVGLIITITPVLIWLLVRYYLGQSKSHSNAIGSISKYSFFEYLSQFSNGVGYYLGPKILGVLMFLFSSLLLIYLLFRKPYNVSTSLKPISFIIISSTFLLFILFNLMWIDHNLNGRFIWILPIFLIGFFSVQYSWENNKSIKRVIVLFISFVTIFQLLRTAKHIQYVLNDNLLSNVNVLPNNRIDPNYYSSHIQFSKSDIIIPPDFKWIDRNYNDTNESK